MARPAGSLAAGTVAAMPRLDSLAAVAPALACAAAVMVPLGYLPVLASVFVEPKLALLSIAGAAGLGLALLERARRAATRPRLERVLVPAVMAWLVTTLLAAAMARLLGPAPGAPYAGDEIRRALAVTGVALAVAQAVVDGEWRQRLLLATQVGAGAVSIIGLLQHLQLLPFKFPVISVPGSTFGNRNVAAEAIAMSIPFGLAALATARRAPGRVGPSPLLAALALQIVYLGATRTRGAWLGAAAGVAVFFLLRRRAIPRLALLAAAGLGVAGLAAAIIPGRIVPRDLADTKRFEPVGTVVRDALDASSPVARTRFGLWRRTWRMYAAHPALGVGPGNFVVFFPLYAEPGARVDGVQTPRVVPRRAHQDLLERLAETGPLGLFAWLAVYGAGLAIAVQRAREADAPPAAPADADADGPTSVTSSAASKTDLRAAAALAAGAAGSLAALFACGLTGFPLAMPATVFSLGVALGCLGCGGAHGPDIGAAGAGSPARRRLAVAAAALAALALVGYAGVTVAGGLRRSYGLARARVALGAPVHPGAEREGAAQALTALERAERADPGRFQVALETGNVLLHLGRYAEALAAIDRALAVEPHSSNAWALRAKTALAAGDPRRAAIDASFATTLLADYPDALATRARAEAQLGDLAAARTARAALATLATTGDADAQRLLDTLPGASP